MSLLGKILAILNIFGAIALISLASLDYAKRQAWAQSVFRADLLLQGLPLDSNAKTPEGQPIAELINDETKKVLFPGGNPVLTQEDEVRRVQNEVQNNIQEFTNKGGETLVAYANLLLPFARTNAQRELLEAYQIYLSKPDQAKQLVTALDQAWQEAKSQTSPRDAFAAALTSRRLEDALPLADRLFPMLYANKDKSVTQAFTESLDAQRSQAVADRDELFRQALNQPNPNEPKLNPDEQRKVIARLLFNLSGGDAAAIQRLIGVVGLRSAVTAIQEESHDLALATMTLAVQNDRGRERAQFALRNQAMVEAIREKAEVVAAETALQKRKLDQQVAHEEELRKRQRNVREIKEELDDARRKTAEQMKYLTTMTQQLYDVRIRLRDATLKNQGYEKEIRALEGNR
jgi:hypothetical protein